jgi:Fe-S cluster biogenesis protein NfuA
MRDEVQKALDEVRPYLQQDGGDVELVDVTSGNVVQVRLRGACGTCPGAIYTLKMGIERHLKERLPQVTSVEAVP